MCIGNTTTPQATSNIYWRRPEEWTAPGESEAPMDIASATPAKKSALKAPTKTAQSSKTTGGTY